MVLGLEMINEVTPRLFTSGKFVAQILISKAAYFRSSS